MKKMEELTFADNDYFLLLFSKKITFSLKNRREQPLRKTCYSWGRTTCANIDKVGNLGNLLLIREECGNLKINLDVGELTQNVNKKKEVNCFISLFMSFLQQMP